MHEQLLHAGPESTHSVLQQEIWLTKGRREVKRVPRKCLVCQRQRVGPCSQKMTPLQSERVSSSPAFTHVGIDFAGPLFVLGGPTSTKAYICIFACASSRMTYLELTIDLSTNEFFQTLIRMTSPTMQRCSRVPTARSNSCSYKSRPPIGDCGTKQIKKSSRPN